MFDKMEGNFFLDELHVQFYSWSSSMKNFLSFLTFDQTYPKKKEGQTNGKEEAKIVCTHKNLKSRVGMTTKNVL